MSASAIASSICVNIFCLETIMVVLGAFLRIYICFRSFSMYCLVKLQAQNYETVCKMLYFTFVLLEESCWRAPNSGPQPHPHHQPAQSNRTPQEIRMSDISATCPLIADKLC